MLRIVVTGGAGFIGSNLVAAYARDGHRVTIVDSLCRPGVERNLEWLRGLAAGTRLRVVRGDVRDAELVRRVVGAPDVDLVFHLAAQPAVTTSIAHPRDDLETNLLGTFNVLEAVRTSEAAPPPALFFTSTNKVYGAVSRHRTIEKATRYAFADASLNRRGLDESEPLDFHSPYGCSKGAADQYVRDYGRIYGLRTVVFRMSCVYGPRQFGTEDQGWLAHFLISAAFGRPLTIYGDGKQVRDVLYVDDLVRAFRQAAGRLDVAAGGVYNIGGGPENSVSIWSELQPRLERLASLPVRPQRRECRPGDQRLYVSDTTAAARDFGWRPTVGVDEGIRRLWAWVQSNRSLFSSSRERTGALADDPVEDDSLLSGVPATASRW